MFSCIKIFIYIQPFITIYLSFIKNSSIVDEMHAWLENYIIFKYKQMIMRKIDEGDEIDETVKEGKHALIAFKLIWDIHTQF